MGMTYGTPSVVLPELVYARCFVQSFGWYEGPGFLSISMKYCPSGDLKNYLSQRKRLSEVETQDIISQVVEGLYFMHREGFAHRDLKQG
jgi:serine/threonine protein kinase